ncbi:MAG: hypothetical protein KDD00_01240 [Ignavibacteriae bacterium]|nr:hypothetical protein [Ignavibacteriota bacterium]
MPNPTEVAIYKRDGSLSLYTSYASARADAVDFDLIQIRADLNETIILKDKVDIWIMPGVVIDYNPSAPGPTITDNNVDVESNIYGMGIIQNTRNNSSSLLNTILISNSNSKISIDCDLIENESPGLTISCISSNAAKFFLKCNNVFSKRGGAIFLNNNNSIININVTKIETGLEGDFNTGSTAVISRGSGFIKIDEILCRNLGHCISHRAGTITANIKKMTTINNRSGVISTVHLNQGDNNQKLILYFDEISNLAGTNTSLCGIEVSQGTGIFIGRKVYSEILNDTEGATIQIGGTSVKGFIKINEIISKNSGALVLNQFTSQILVISNYIEGNKTGDGGVIFSYDSANFVLKNATVRNVNSGSSVKGIGLFKNSGNGNIPNVAFQNVKIISNGAIVYYNTSTPDIEIKNYGLIGNKDIEGNVMLKVGTADNFVFIFSNELT